MEQKQKASRSMYYDSQTQNNLMQRFGDQKQKVSTNVSLYAASTRFTQPNSERQRELSLKDKDSSVVTRTRQLKDP